MSVASIALVNVKKEKTGQRKFSPPKLALLILIAVPAHYGLNSD